MKLIELSKGGKKYDGMFSAMVDDEDYEFLTKWNWHVYNGRNTKYAARLEKVDGEYVLVIMHRVIMGLTKRGLIVDHIDRDGLNNQRCNLRVCTYSQNNANTRKYKNSVSKYRGVSVIKRVVKGKLYAYWVANVRHNNTLHYLGNFKVEEDAARAYDAKAKELFGEFANLNFKQ